MNGLTCFQLPRLRGLALRAAPHLVESTLAPLAIFYLLLRISGVWGALVGALAWSYAAIGRRLLLRRRIPGMLALGALALTVRTAIAAATGSVMIYFLQPTLGTVALAGAFLVSVRLNRPLAQRLAADFLPVDAEFFAHPVVARFFSQISILWAFVMLANAAVTSWLLLSQPVGVFVLARSGASTALTVAAIAVSTVWFRWSLRRHSIAVSFTG